MASTPTTTQSAPATTGLQFPQFYKPDPNNPNVYDAQGNLVSLQQYKEATQQTGVPDDQVNFGYIQPTMPGAAQTSAFTPDAYGISQDVWNSLTPSDQAFIQSAATVVQSQYNNGQSATVDPDTWAKALQIAQTDPDIAATYGDAAKQGAAQLAFNVGQITGNYKTSQALQDQTLALQKKSLADQYAQAGAAYSGFRQQAKEQLATSQADVIQSSRSQLQQQLQNLGSSYESQFGSAATPAIKVAGVGTDAGAQYTPVGGITGTQPLSQTQAVQSRAQEYLPTYAQGTSTVSTK